MNVVSLIFCAMPTSKKCLYKRTFRDSGNMASLKGQQSFASCLQSMYFIILSLSLIFLGEFLNYVGWFPPSTLHLDLHSGRLLGRNTYFACMVTKIK